MPHQNAWYLTYNCTNDWEKLREQIAKDEKNEITLKPETPVQHTKTKNQQ